jgi:hypothetical protein
MGIKEFIEMIDEMMVNPPMRGDIALSDLRNLLLQKQKEERVLNLVNKQYKEAWVRSVDGNI